MHIHILDSRTGRGILPQDSVFDGRRLRRHPTLAALGLAGGGPIPLHRDTTIYMYI